MTMKRFVAICAVVFLLAEVFATVVHGMILNADYEPYRGTLLRSMDSGPAWPFAFLPVAHLSFAVAFVWLYTRTVRPGPWLRQGLRFGVIAWLMAPVPLWLLWYAEQPWPGSLVTKQLALELLSTLILGVVVGAMARPSIAVPRSADIPSAAIRHS
jgi:hypothetical protein